MLLPGDESIALTHLHNEFLQMREDCTFKPGFGKIHVGSQAQKLCNHRILDELQLVLFIRRRQDFISDTTFSFFGDWSRR